MSAVHVYTSFAERARKLVAGALGSFGAFGVGWTRHLRRGDIRENIRVAAVETRADLVIVGSRPRSLFERIVFGSVSREVIEDVACDVRAVPVRAQARLVALRWAGAPQ